ncbi:MAG: hypothetical protein KF886_03110 [Candidatus Hydrogenedentes bacterium]|nr:hypothetical protein [Candidatus Hydrogenedentota bacterium]
MQTTENKILARVRRAGPGSAFTPKDFLDLAGYEAAKKGLLRLANAGTLRRPLRGVYDFPAYSAVRRGPASPDPDAIAHAIARAHGWTLVPTGVTALNLLGLSTQVPAQWEYFSDGPTKQYEWDGGRIHLKRRANKETTGLSPRTALLVHALKALGEERVEEQTLDSLRKRLTRRELINALRETRYVTTWVHEIIRRLAAGEDTSDA